MSLIPWTKPERPHREATNLQSEINRLFDGFFSNSASVPQEASTWGPPISVREGGKSILVECELPGIEAKDVDISVDDDILTIRGEKTEETKREDEEQYNFERRFGSFLRRIRLPAPVDSGHVEAVMKMGVLSVKLPKSQPRERRSIKVKSKD
ncbi:MAG: Hsp20/alpha crystallin family protein [Nannocystaceae bacterium]